jgi:hypothetical protein
MTNASSGYGVHPITWTRRDCTSSRNATKYVTKPRAVHTSLVKKSAATSAGQCAWMNVRQVMGRCRLGGMPAARRMRAIVAATGQIRPFPCHQLAMPAQDGVRRYEGRDLRE